MTQDEVLTLLSEYRKGSITARNDIIVAHINVVHNTLHKSAFFRGIVGSGKYNFDDLYSMGCLALIKSVDNYNKEKGTKYLTYAHFFVRTNIIDQLRANKINFNESSYDQDLDDDGSSAKIIDLMADESSLDFVDEAENIVPDLLHRAIKRRLSIEQKAIFMHKYYGGSQKEIARALGVSNSRVSQIYNDGLDKLKRYFERRNKHFEIKSLSQIRDNLE